ncbi:putative aminodeoxychorismate synthase [Rosellinia necatrix]|uniref:aminodeoxychorismate synthase n=1 Tax=Rosellinia necatrix TaxID=77044 RepID=A0A1W2TT38_ROSNE|nr:putative aminodeoxychorismate synthase [Rosellinia necatrix]
MGRPRILFIDAYDSFSNNIVSLLTTILDADVDVLPIDPPHLLDLREDAGFADALAAQVRPYDAVVCGPGPGAPDVDGDVGIMKHVWRLRDRDVVPVLGICLGFQSLAVHGGAVVRRLRTGLHGMIREIEHRGATVTAAEEGDDDGNIFAGVPAFRATLYHSLHADVGQQSVPAAQWESAKWSPAPLLPDLVPLAWTYEDRGDMVERILMGVRHRTRPFWGLQYHPESICTETAGHQVIANWFREATAWNRATGRTPESAAPETTEGPKAHDDNDDDTPKPSTWSQNSGALASLGLGAKYLSTSLDIPLHIEVPDVVEILQEGQGELIVFDSASAKLQRKGVDVRGRYSIIALDVDEALKVEYSTGDRHVTARTASTAVRVDLGPGQTIWQFLAEFWAERQIPADEAPGPFAGGFMGYTTYELGLEGIGVRPLGVEGRRQRHGGHSRRADLCFAWVTRSVVIDHLEGSLRAQTLSSAASEPAGREWLARTVAALTGAPVWSDALPTDFGKIRAAAEQQQQLTPPQTPTSGHLLAPKISAPAAPEYEAKVRACQSSIAAGDSYELCLTDQTVITRARSRHEGTLRPPSQQQQPQPSHDDQKKNNNNNSAATTTTTTTAPTTPSSWQLYRSLRTRQPAPFGSYVRLGAATLVSSSPERFLAYDASGLCSMRPMKGTVRKSPGVATLAAAERVLRVPKEEAENLMIVDLVRHDLHGVCGPGPGRVRVPRLLRVEEYASVFQMISVVEGRLPLPDSARGKGNRGKGKTGFDVLAAALPPGSMTGAPKRRSCEILQGVEGPRARRRGLYSGVVGYADVAGRGDWSVTIRSLFRWDDETFSSSLPQSSSSLLLSTATEAAAATTVETMEVWRIGAGGAVTALSTPEGETDEMFAKLKGPVSVFEEA